MTLAKAALGAATVAAAIHGVQAQGGTPHLPADFKVANVVSAPTVDFGIKKHKVCPCVDDPIPGKHCEDIQVDLSDAHAQEWWGANKYAYTEYADGLCDSSLYSTVNHKITPPSACGVGVHEGECHVILRRLGQSSLADTAPVEAVYDEYCLHQEDTEDHKCFEACNAEGHTFKSKGITGTGTCPTKYNTVDKTVKVQQCPDGVTSIRYCNPINVTIATKGESGGFTGMVNAGGMLNVRCQNPSTCLQLNIPGGADSEFWKANSYKYDPKEHPECAQATCGSAYPQFESVVHNVQGYAGVDLVKYGKP